MTDLDTVATWRKKQSRAAELLESLVARWAGGWKIRKSEAKALADLQRVANFDKKITPDEIRIRLRAGDWK